MPPSAATSSSPPGGVAAIPTIGLFSTDRRLIAVVGEVPEREESPECGHHAVAGPVAARGHADDLAVGQDRGAKGRGRRRWRRSPTGARSARRCRRPLRWWWCRSGRPPRGDAGHHPADDPADAVDVLVALPVAELEAPGDVGVAAIGSAAAIGPVASRLAEAPPVSASRVALAGRVAVHVVARAAAVRGVVGLPPTAHDGVGRAVVVAPVDRAAEFAESGAAGRAAPAVAVAAAADQPVGGSRLERQVEAGADGHRTACIGRAVDEAATRDLGLEEARGPVDQGWRHGPVVNPVDPKASATGRRTDWRRVSTERTR